MNTGTALVVRELKYEITPREELDAMFVAVRLIEQYQMAIEPPCVCGRWTAFALVDGKHVLEFGDSLVEAARNLARTIGGAQ